jgi:4'-phosphopantetheinyl transferase
MPPSVPAIDSLKLSDIHVWHATLSLTPEALADAARLLPKAEREKTGLVASVAQRARLTLSRAWVRAILSGYLERPAPELTIRRSGRGKPIVVVDADQTGLFFSVSHSGEHMLVAVTRADDVGIDLERLTRIVEPERIAVRFYSRPECEALLSLEPAMRADAFFRVWVRKEAVVKALGMGITAAFEMFSVSQGREEQVEVDVSRVLEGGRERLWVRVVDVGRVDYLAAVAFGQPDATVRYFEWN